MSTHQASPQSFLKLVPPRGYHREYATEEYGSYGLTYNFWFLPEASTKDFLISLGTHYPNNIIEVLTNVRTFAVNINLWSSARDFLTPRSLPFLVQELQMVVGKYCCLKDPESYIVNVLYNFPEGKKVMGLFGNDSHTLEYSFQSDMWSQLPPGDKDKYASLRGDSKDPNSPSENVVEREDLLGSEDYVVYPFTLHMPYIRLNGSNFAKLLRLFVAHLQEIPYYKIRDSFNSPLVGNLHDCVDVSLPIMNYAFTQFYGTYLVSYRHLGWDLFASEEPFEESIKKHMAYVHDLFDPLRHAQLKLFLSSEDLQSLPPESWYPFFFSNFYEGYKITPMQDIETINLLYKFLDMINFKSLRLGYRWVILGRILANTTNFSLDGLWRWQELSREFYPPEACVERYKSFYYESYTRNYTIHTLAMFAREDTPEEYEKWHQEWFKESLDACDKINDYTLGCIFYRYFWLDYVGVHVDDTHVQLYRFQGTHWDQKGYSCLMDVNNHLQKAIVNHIASITQLFNDDIGNVQKETLMKKIDIFNKALNSLQKATFVNNALVQQLRALFPVIKHPLDNNYRLINVSNGILEADDRQVFFRPCLPEDYVTNIVPLEYNHYYTDRDPIIQEVYGFLDKVFPNRELRDYVLKIFASCLYGRNNDKIMVIMTGKGNNAKSIMKKFLQSAFGPYFADVASTLFTSDRPSASQATPELAKVVNKRIIMGQETKSKAKMRANVIKELTGGDTFSARQLYSTSIVIDPTFHVFHMCNGIPEIDEIDIAIQNRLRVIPYLSTWSQNAPEDPEEQWKKLTFKQDKNFDRQIPRLAPGFLWVLVKYYRKYREEGLMEPAIVTQWTKDYWERNDVYVRFLRECVEYGEGFSTLKSTIYETFQKWLFHNFPSKNLRDIPPTMDFHELMMDRKLEEQDERTWKNVALKKNLEFLAASRFQGIQGLE